MIDAAISNAHLHELDQKYYLPTFKRYPLALKKGQGAKVWDVEGNVYLDALAGIAVNNLGHCHPKISEAICQQAQELIHISNFYVSEPQVALSEKLVKASGLDRVFFGNSGAEAVEGAIKVARKYAHKKGRENGAVISMQNCFHGRTLATIAAGKSKMQQGFGPMPEGFRKVPFNGMEELRNLIGEDTAAIIVEPVQGEGGIHPAQPCFLRAVRELCDEKDIVLIFDEIQCGIARTGSLFAKDQYEVQPDIMTLAKGLGSGVPIGAFLCSEKIAGAIDYGDHGTTFGGNPLACAAGLATLEVIEEENLSQQAEEKGAYLRRRLEENLSQLPEFKEIRGLGLMIGVEFTFETKPLVLEMLQRGVLSNATAGNVLRLVPPLVISYDELDHLISVVTDSVHATPKS